MKMQINYTAYFFRFFTLVIFLCIELHHLVAFGADGEKFYGYWYFGHNSGLNIGNETTKSEYNRFKAEHPSIKTGWITDIKMTAYEHKANGHYFGLMLAGGGYGAEQDAGEFIDIMIFRFYFNYLHFLFSKNKGLFVELSGGPVMAGYSWKRTDDVTATDSGSYQEYGYGASFALGYEFKLVSWFGLNVQGSYNFAHSTALGDVTWKDYGAAVSVAF